MTTCRDPGFYRHPCDSRYSESLDISVESLDNGRPLTWHSSYVLIDGPPTTLEKCYKTQHLKPEAFIYLRNSKFDQDHQAPERICIPIYQGKLGPGKLVHGPVIQQVHKLVQAGFERELGSGTCLQWVYPSPYDRIITQVFNLLTDVNGSRTATRAHPCEYNGPKNQKTGTGNHQYYNSLPSTFGNCRREKAAVAFLDTLRNLRLPGSPMGCTPLFHDVTSKEDLDLGVEDNKSGLCISRKEDAWVFHYNPVSGVPPEKSQKSQPLNWVISSIKDNQKPEEILHIGNS